MSGIILVRDIMTKNVKTVRPDDTALDAVRKMIKFRIGSVIVTNGGRPVGIITERNILEGVVAPRHDAGIVKAKDIMGRPLITVDVNASVEEAAHIMAQKVIKTLPVVEKEKVVGVLTSSDIVRTSPTQLRILEELLRVG
jgi:CBS domain-containing protein